MSKFKRKEIPKKRVRKNNKKPIVMKGGNGNGNGSNGKLTRNEKIFVDEWLIDRNGTRAYKVAYPRIKNDNSAGVAAFNMLRKFKVDAYIQKRLQKLSATAQLDQEWVLGNYKKLVDFTFEEIFNDDGSMKPISEWSENAKFAATGLKRLYKKTKKTSKLGIISESEMTMNDLKFADKKEVIDQIGKYLGMFDNDNKQKGLGQGNTIIGKNIQVNLVDDGGNIISRG